MSRDPILGTRLAEARVAAGYRTRAQAVRGYLDLRKGEIAYGTAKNSIDNWENGVYVPNTAAQQDLIELYDLDEYFFIEYELEKRLAKQLDAALKSMEERAAQFDAKVDRLEKALGVDGATPGEAREIVVETLGTLVQEPQRADSDSGPSPD